VYFVISSSYIKNEAMLNFLDNSTGTHGRFHYRHRPRNKRKEEGDKKSTITLFHARGASNTVP
jgi:hypothetical protein